MAPASTRPAIRKKTIAAALGASLLLAFFIAGLAFANSVGAAQVAENARRLHWANAALGTSSLTRAALVQTLTFAELEANGMATADEVDFAIEQATSAVAELVELEGHDLAPSMQSFVELSVFTQLASDVLGSLRSRDLSDAEALLLGEAETVYEALEDRLSAEQVGIQAAIADNTQASARTNSYIIFVLTLAIPAAAVATYWWIARRQVREYRIKAEAEVEAERSVSRAKDSFIAGLSHELKTPLTSIYGFAEVLTDSPGAEDQTPELARIIATEAAELTRMVDDLLVAARLDSTGVEVDLAPTKLFDVVQRAVLRFERAGASIQLRPSTEVVLADAGRLDHVLVNLVSNALRHGGPDVGIDVNEAGGWVDLEVWDNGPGVAEDRIERLFERFVHDGHETLLAGSVGLGLAVASRLTEMMGGELIHQRYSNRTYFIVRLPRPPAELGEREESVADVIRAMSA